MVSERILRIECILKNTEDIIMVSERILRIDWFLREYLGSNGIWENIEDIMVSGRTFSLLVIFGQHCNSKIWDVYVHVTHYLYGYSFNQCQCFWKTTTQALWQRVSLRASIIHSLSIKIGSSSFVYFVYNSKPMIWVV